MYMALGIMLLGVAIGRLANKIVSLKVLHCLTLLVIFILLFLLGLSIGSNKELMQRLPILGWQALAIMLACVAGSIFVATLTAHLLKSCGKPLIK